MAAETTAEHSKPDEKKNQNKNQMNASKINTFCSMSGHMNSPKLKASTKTETQNLQTHKTEINSPKQASTRFLKEVTLGGSITSEVSHIKTRRTPNDLKTTTNILNKMFPRSNRLFQQNKTPFLSF